MTSISMTISTVRRWPSFPSLSAPEAVNSRLRRVVARAEAADVTELREANEELSRLDRVRAANLAARIMVLGLLGAVSVVAGAWIGALA